MRKKILLVAMMTVAACGLGAQTITWQQDEGFLHPAGITSPAGRDVLEWAWGDVDADGRLDILLVRFDYDVCCSVDILTETAPGSGVFQKNETLLQELNLPPGSGKMYLAELVAGNETPEVVFSAFDSDQGRMSIVVLQRDSSGVWQQDWQMLDALAWLAQGGFGTGSGLAFLDADADGDSDIFATEVAASDSLPLRYRFYENTGTAAQPVLTENPDRIAGITLPQSDRYLAAVLIDVDDDGITDILQPQIIEGQQQVRYIPGQQDSSGTFWSGELQWLPFPEVFRLGCLTVFDINADGRDDLLSSFDMLLFPAESSGAYFTPEVYALDLNTGRPLNLLPTRFVRDQGELLVITEDRHGFVTLLTGSFFVPDTLNSMPLWRRLSKTTLLADQPPTGSFYAEMTDLDRDGEPELSGWLGTHDRPADGRFFAFVYSDTAAIPAWVERSDLLQGLENIAGSDTLHLLPTFADLDGDGREDALLRRVRAVGPDSGRVEFAFFKNLAVSGKIIWQERPDWQAGLPDTSFHQAVLTDLDHDGDADLVLGFRNSGVPPADLFAFYENTGESAPTWRAKTGMLPEHIAFGGFAGLTATPEFLFADFDRDGDDDFLIREQQAGMVFLRNQLITRVSAPSRQVLPGELHLQAWPNPMVRQGRYSFSLRREGRIGLRLYNVIGQVVRVIEEGHRPAGKHSGVIRVESLPSGLYFLRLTAGGSTVTRPLMIVR